MSAFDGLNLVYQKITSCQPRTNFAKEFFAAHGGRIGQSTEGGQYYSY